MTITRLENLVVNTQHGRLHRVCENGYYDLNVQYECDSPFHGSFICREIRGSHLTA